MILEAAGLIEYQPTAQSTHAFNDLALGSRVHATLITSPSIRGSVLDVHADDGHIHVKGRVDHEALADKVEKLALNLPGVSGVTTDLYSVPPEPL